MDRSEPVARVRNLSCTYGGSFTGGEKALKHINLELYRNQFVAIIGQNGAGKSTLLKFLIGLLKPQEGDVTILGTDTRKIAISELASKVGFVLQNPDLQLFASTVREEVAYGLENQGIQGKEQERRVLAALKKVGLDGELETFPLTLSKGDRAKVVIASVLAMDPELIILDEPTSGQDYRGSIQIMDIARQLLDEGKTVIVVTHNMDLVARYAERVIVLKKGELAMDGSVRDIFSRRDQLLETHITPPHITRLGASLGDVLNTDDVFLEVKELGDVLVSCYRNDHREGV